MEGTTIIGTNATLNYNFPIGPHTLTLTVTDNDNLTSTDEVLINIIQPFSRETAHIGDISLVINEVINGKNRFCSVTATISVLNQENLSIAGADVTAT